MKLPVCLLFLGLSACAAPRVGVGVGYGVGDVRLGVSSSDLGRTVTPTVGIRSGHFYGWTAGPRVPLRDNPPPPRREDPYTGWVAPGAVVEGQAAPGVEPGADG